MHNQGRKSLSFFDIGGSGDLTGSVALFLATEVEILLVLGHKGEQPILPPRDLIGGIHPSNLGRTDEFDHIVPNNQHLTIQLPQIKTLLFPDSTKNKKIGIMSGYHVLSYSYMKMRDTRCIG